MRRLIDESHVDSKNELLADLIRAMPPTESDSVRKQRVLARVRSVQRSARPRLRIAVAAVLLASSSATAAAVGHVAIRARLFPGSPSEPSATKVTAPIPKSTSPKNTFKPKEPIPPEESLIAPAEPVEAFPPTAMPADPLPARPPPTGLPTHAKTTEALSSRAEAEWKQPDTTQVAPTQPLPSAAANEPPATDAPPSMGAAPTAPPVAPDQAATLGDSPHAQDREDAAQVVGAISALRNDGDGVRSGALLANYLRAHPRGVLAEDALALSIEAAAARHDNASAREFGRRYLAQYATGRFRGVALRALKLGP